MPTKTLRLPLPGCFYRVAATVAGDVVTVVSVEMTDMSFRHRLAVSDEPSLRAHLTELGLTWEAAVVAKLTGKAAA